ncbi:sugar kinase [Naasia sp. SYSU D00057]|uniref:sugar kinase n=1 Tax=Naasia sp. SYSU D00057 TaxID=2817380 RepID=UPI001B30F1C7|nr:sugar kinase [Naasia sp. SYSU D00057]
MSGGLVTLGETMALFRPTGIGSLAHESEFRLAIGGAESNVAIGVARLGGTAAWIGRVGADSLGERVSRELRAERVDARVVVDGGARTGLMIKERRTPDHTGVLYYRAGSAGSRISPDDLDGALIRAAGVLHITGITPALSTSAAGAVFAAVDLADEAGVPVSFDVNHRATLWSAAEAVPVYQELARRADLVFAGEDEAAMLVGNGPPADLAARIAALGPGQVLIKRGAEGCFALIDGVAHEVAARTVSVVDTVGAGDAFVAGYLAELLAGEPAAARLATAVAAGAFACLGPGDWESLPRRADLAMLDRTDPVTR